MRNNNHFPYIYKPVSIIFLLALLTGAAGCVQLKEAQQPLPTPYSQMQQYTPTPTITVEPTQKLTATINPLVTLTPTPDPYSDITIEALIARSYGGGVLEDAGNLNGIVGFTRKLFRYRSESLDLYGFINIPEGEGPFPVIVLVHGYVDPAKYKTLDYSVRYADALVEAGYITVHPNLRGYAPSEKGVNILGTGDTIDVLNLIALIRQQAGSAGLLEKADEERIGLWGHSMGGGVLLRAIIVDPDIKAGLLYASIHANEEFNLAYFEKDGRGNEKVTAPASILALLSPYNYLDHISAPLSIHHGGQDDVVPPLWSRTLCETITELGKDVVCREYPDQPHTFQNSGDVEFMRDMIAFFDREVR